MRPLFCSFMFLLKFVLLYSIFFQVSAQGESMLGYYRFPAIHQDKILFTAEGDLWSISIFGGVAQRLTTHLGIESHAKISPDGSTVAFSAQYEGPIEVYTMPIQGGVPKRQTYEGESAWVIGWKEDGKILYSTQYYSTLPNTQVAILDVKTGQSSLVPLTQASEGCFNAENDVFFFTRLAFQGSHTKRYKGGTVQQIWKFLLSAGQSFSLTSDYPGTSKHPMWWQKRLYFVSDRDGTMNLWSMNEEGNDLQQLTFHQGWEIKSPSFHQGRIVYQLGADLHLFDITSRTDQKLSIQLASDFDQKRERWLKNPAKYLTSVDFSPKGDRLLLTARGQVFVLPARRGRLVEATRKKGVRYRHSRFLPDGKSILMLSDETGELEFWKTPTNGVGEAEQISSDGKTLRFTGIPSPDGKWVAFTDKDLKIGLYHLEEKRSVFIETSQMDDFFHLRWAPDSQWLAYVGLAENFCAQIKLYHLPSQKIYPVTSDRVDSYNPTWSVDGKWLYFLSDRSFQSIVPSPWGPRQPEPFFDKTTKIYMLALQSGVRFPFQPADELMLSPESEEENTSEEKDKKKEDDSKTVTVEIELDGLAKRLYEIPLSAGSYQSLSVNQKYLFWIERETGLDGAKNLMSLEIKNKEIKPKALVKKVKRYNLSQNGKKILVQKEEQFYVFSADDKPEELEKHQVDLTNWTFPIDPKEEWRQIFKEAWRLERDYFYDRNLHGLNWPAVLEKYLPLVDRVSDREELSDLMAQMVSELSALHIFVVGGDKREGEDKIFMGDLGAVLERDEGNGGYRIQHIYQSDPDHLEKSSPLAKPHISVEEGDLITAINGVSTLSVAHPSLLLRNQAEKQVLLHLKSKKTQQLYETIVIPMKSQEAKNLRYSEWEYTRRLYVEEKSAGDIGYVHLRAMSGENYTEWVHQFYPVFHRQGLIVDVRHNRGGNIDSWILEKLLRKAWFYWQPRTGRPYWNMQYAFRGHLVVICNEWTASDGEAFAEGVRRLQLGKIIGTRTWGGEIWLSFNNWLVDKGIASAAETGVYGPEGEWLIEGHGVDPDIIVDNLPCETYQGKDAQLETALEHLKEQIRLHPIEVPKSPKYPDKSADYK